MWRGDSGSLPVAIFIAAISEDQGTLAPLWRPEAFGQDYGLAIVDCPMIQDVEAANYCMEFKHASEMDPDKTGFFVRITRKAGVSALPVGQKLIVG